MHSFSASVNSGPPSESPREKIEDGRGQNRLIALTRGIAANDDRTVEARSEAAMLILVRLIDRRMTLEALEKLNAANDNRPARGVGER